MPKQSITEIYEEQRGNVADREGQTLPTYRYPIHLDNFNSDNVTPILQECIHFTAVKQGGISLQAEADNSKAIAEAEADQHRQEMIHKNGMLKTGSSGSYVHPDNTARENRDADYATTQAENGERADKSIVGIMAEGAKKGLKKVGEVVTTQMKAMQQKPKNLEHCFLYMPSSVQYEEGASWGAAELGGLGNMIKQGLRGQGSATDIVKNFSGGTITGLAKAVAVGGGALAAGAIGALGVASLFEGVGSGLRAAGRFTENPYEEQLFNGIGFREFSFEFAFAPASEAEGNEVDKIIKMFRFHSRPNFVGGWLGEGLYTFPNEFNIEFLMNEGGKFVVHKFLPKLYNCVCTNVSTNYSPEGFYVALRDGRPVSYNLSLAFTETVKITQDDIAIKGY